MYETTGYGEMLGLYGINYYHNMRPTWEDEKIPAPLDPVENKRIEELNKRHRALERKKRKYNRLYETAQTTEDREKYKAKLEKSNDDLEKFTKENNRQRDYERERIGIGKYDSITKKWIEDKGTEKGIVSNQEYFIDKNNVRYEVDGVNVILDHTKSEEKIANWYANMKKNDINMLPRVLNPKDVKSGDFIEKSTQITWEIKEPEGNTRETTMTNQFKGQKEKAKKFIIDLHKSEMPINMAIEDIEIILASERYSWVEEVILLKDLELIKVFKK